MSGQSNFVLKGSSIFRIAVEFDLQSSCDLTLLESDLSDHGCMQFKFSKMLNNETMKNTANLELFCIVVLGILRAALSYWQCLPVNLHSHLLSCSFSAYTCRCL